MSDKAKFTAGTWLKSETPTGKPKVVCGKGGFTIATAGAPPCNHHDFHLMAAAPELYEALEKAMEFIDSHVADPDITNEMAEKWAALCAINPYDVLAKARGES